jgi:hypothetical protein
MDSLRERARWVGVFAGLLLMGSARPVAAMSCGELRLMAAHGVIGNLQRYTVTARCGQETSVDKGTKLTWSGLQSTTKNVSVWMDVIGEASWDRITGEATETLKITGDASGKRLAKGICNQDPFLKDAPGGAATCHGIQAQYVSTGGKLYEWFVQPRFFLSGLISFVEAQALSAKSASSPTTPTPAPPPPTPVHKMSSPSGTKVWEGEGLFSSNKVQLQGGKLGVQPMQAFGSSWSGGSQLLWVNGGIGAVLDLQIDVPEAAVYRVSLALTKGPDFGVIQAEVDGKASATKFDGYSPTVARVDPVELGIFTLRPGQRNVSLMIIGKNSQSTGFLVGVDRIELKPEQVRAR